MTIPFFLLSVRYISYSRELGKGRMGECISTVFASKRSKWGLRSHSFRIASYTPERRESEVGNEYARRIIALSPLRKIPNKIPLLKCRERINREMLVHSWAWGGDKYGADVNLCVRLTRKRTVIEEEVRLCASSV